MGFLYPVAHDHTLHIDSWRDNVVRIQLSGFDQLLDLSDRHLRRSRHHRVEVPRSLAIDQIAQPIALPRLHQSHVRTRARLEHIGPPRDLARLLALGDNGPQTRRRVEGRNPSTSRANPLGQRSLRNQRQRQLALQHHLFEPAVLAHIASDVRGDHSRLEHQPHAEAIDSHIVTDRVQPSEAALDQRGDQVLGNPAQPEAPEHNRRSGGDLGDRRIG